MLSFDHFSPAQEPRTPRPLKPSADFATGDDSPSLSAIASATADPQWSRHDHKFTTGNETSDLAIASSAPRWDRLPACLFLLFPERIGSDSAGLEPWTQADSEITRGARPRGPSFPAKSPKSKAFCLPPLAAICQRTVGGHASRPPPNLAQGYKSINIYFGPRIHRGAS